MESRSPFREGGMFTNMPVGGSVSGNDKPAGGCPPGLTRDEIEYYGLRCLEGETIRKEILITQEYVICHCEEDLTWEILAEVSDLSPGYLQKLYHKWCRLRLRDFQNLCRMEKAAAYLEETTLSVKEISSAVGVRSTSYFSFLFRRVYGLSPKEYRRMYGSSAKRYTEIYG